MFETMRAKRILISGGLGFIGSNLARALADSGAIVTIVDSLIPEYGGHPYNLDGYTDRVRINISDIRDVYSLRYLVRGQDFLFNLAGQTSHLDSMKDPFTDLEINCKAQLSLLEVCREYNPDVKIVFASTRQIYGKPSYLPVDEQHILRPVDVNGINKMAGEWYHILYNNVYGLRATALRLTNTYGPRMRIKDARQTFVGLWIRMLLEGNAIEVWGGEQLRDFTYVDDVVRALVLSASTPEADGQVINLGGDCVLSLHELARLMVDVNGGGEIDLREFPTERKRIDIGDYYGDYSLARRCIGWHPLVSLKEGLKTSLDYYRRYMPFYL